MVMVSLYMIAKSCMLCCLFVKTLSRLLSVSIGSSSLVNSGGEVVMVGVWQSFEMLPGRLLGRVEDELVCKASSTNYTHV